MCRLIVLFAASAFVAGCGSAVGPGSVSTYDLAFVREDIPGVVSLWQLGSSGAGFAMTASGLDRPAKAAFSPDGSKVAMMLQRNGQYDIGIMRTHGGAIQWLTDDPSDDGDPSFSVDGTRIVFYSRRDGHSQIYVMDADGSGQTRLTNTPGFTDDDTSPAFSRDGTKIAFASTRNSTSGVKHIHTMDADGGNVRQLTSDDSTSDTDPSFSPDGLQIVYAASSNTFDRQGIYSVRYDGTGKYQLAEGWENCHSPSYSPDGWTIAFVSDHRTGSQQIWFMNRSGSGKGRITDEGGEFPSWMSGH